MLSARLGNAGLGWALCSEGMQKRKHMADLSPRGACLCLRASFVSQILQEIDESEFVPSLHLGKRGWNLFSGLSVLISALRRMALVSRGFQF